MRMNAGLEAKGPVVIVPPTYMSECRRSPVRTYESARVHSKDGQSNVPRSGVFFSKHKTTPLHPSSSSAFSRMPQTLSRRLTSSNLPPLTYSVLVPIAGFWRTAPFHSGTTSSRSTTVVGRAWMAEVAGKMESRTVGAWTMSDSEERGVRRGLVGWTRGCFVAQITSEGEQGGEGG